MRTLALFAISLISSACFAWDETLPAPYYQVVSDIAKDDVPKGKCRVKGKAMMGGEPIAGGKIATLSGSSSCFSNKEGEFEMMIPSKDTSIFFYHLQYQEIVVWRYNFKSGFEVELNFHTMSVLDGIYIQEKPVLYCYSDQALTADIQLEKASQLTYSYPKYEEGWKIELAADQSGDIRLGSKSFPYLFYETESTEMEFPVVDGKAEGDFVNSKDVISYLEIKLREFQLTERESADFITYWGPRLMQKEHAFVQFFIDDECADQIGALNINPKPDNLRRVFILFETTDLPLSEHPNWIEAEENIEYRQIDRSGFTVIEWGGTELSRSATDNL